LIFKNGLFGSFIKVCWLAVITPFDKGYPPFIRLLGALAGTFGEERGSICLEGEIFDFKAD